MICKSKLYFFNFSRPSGTLPPIKLKIKTKAGRGYNPSLVNYKDSEYHYGSDFEDEGEESDAQSSKSEESSEDTESSNEDDDLVDSDVEFDAEAIARPSTPIPFWLQTDEDIPELQLPPTSQDLLIPDQYLLKTCSVYEVLRHYSILLRLSPFRFEDFCAALSSEDQSNLLSEIHIALLKSIVRAEEKDGVQFGPLDYKDSMNTILFFMDSLTWPESLKLYLLSDPTLYAGPLGIFEKNKEYPLISTGTNASSSIENRISMLSYLADQFLTTTAVRDDIVNEGRQAPEDHCRICHRLGDMIVCEHCAGIYHFTCLDPPLDDVPEDDWQCYVCQANQVSGVTDNISEKEKLGELHRHESLGIDRSGNKYWFLCRRLIVEKRDGDGIIAYYTTAKQLEELINSLDSKLYEHDLVESIESIRDNIEENMKLTESITLEKKPQNRQSYIELENASIEKLQKEREDMKQQIIDEKRRSEEETDRLAKEESEKKRQDEEAVLAEEEEKKKKKREERLKKREEKRGDTWISGDEETALNDSDLKKEIKEEQDCKEENDDGHETLPEERGSPANVNSSSSNLNEIKSEIKSEIKDDPDTKCSDKKPGDSLLAPFNKPTTRAQTGSLPTPKVFDNEQINELRLNERLTRSTVHHITSGTLYFKLGQEQTFKNYINQYTANPAALTKVQASDERNKRTHMSHKFSLTDAAAFKWIGTLYGNRNQLVNTLRQTMIQLEKEISGTFMHPNWTLLRKPWIGAVSQSVTPRDFARALTVIKCCIKPCILLNVWKDSLGHTQFKKITAQMREDKKKSERRERKEREEEDERLRPWMTFVKYTLGLKHQVSKQKGEEYRAHGQNGWLWLSSSRNFSPSDSSKMGLRAGAYRLAVKYTDIRDGSFKIVLMEPKAFTYLLGKQEAIDNDMEKIDTTDTSHDSENQPPKEGDAENKIESKIPKVVLKGDEKPVVERKKLEQALKNAKLNWQVPDEDMFQDVIDVQAALSNPTRILYPKVAKTTRVLDHFLSRRLQLKQLEERRIELKTGVKQVDEDQTKEIKKIEKMGNEDGIVDVEGESDTKTSITSNLATKKVNEPNAITLSKPSKASLPASTCALLAKAKTDIEKILEKLKGDEDISKHLPGQKGQCYSTICETQSTYRCYSPTCQNNKENSSHFLERAITEYQRICDAAVKNGVVVETTVESINTIDDAREHFEKLLKTLLANTSEKSDDSAPPLLSNITLPTSKTATSEITTDVATMINGDIESLPKSKSKTSEESNTSLDKVLEGDSTSTLRAKEDDQSIASHVEETSKSDDVGRVYSSKDTTGRLYLKRIQSVAESKRQGKVVRYPLAPNFYSKSRKKRNILLLAKHDIKHMARKFGITYGEGFNYTAKGNNQVWPYPCPRPFFHTTWSFRTSSSEAIQSVGLQLKILWACVRWDDMNSKTLSSDGKHQVTTDNAITTTEILKHRNTGRFLENTQYFQRKVTIPLNVPSRPRPTSPIRSGLRKRKRAESPTQSEPQLTEQWIDENSLELWEIRAYKDRLEREKYMSITRGRSETVVKGPDRFDPSSYANSIRKKIDNSAYDKDELEKGYRKDPSWEPDSDTRSIRRESSIPRRFNKVYDPKPNSPVQNIVTTPFRSSAGLGANTTPTIIRRITNPDGSISVVRSAGMRPIAPTLGTNINSAGISSPPAKKVFISKDGKVIGTQLIQQTPNGPRIITPSSMRPGVSTTQIVQQNSSPSNITGIQQTPPATPSPQQKVQIVRSADGKIQVRGLLPGQQLVQMPDGRLQIFSSPATGTSTVVTTSNTTTVAAPGPSRMVLQPQTTATLGLSSNVAQVGSVSKHMTSGANSSTPTQVIAQQLPPGAQIPSGMTAFVSGGKTYVIPKTTPTITQQQPIHSGGTTNPNASITTSPSVIGPSISPAVSNKTVILPSSASNVAPQQPSAPKNMVEVKALGQNVVQFKGNQMIVSGPDVQQAQLIAKQLSSGAARLATLGGKQVLISTSAVVNSSSIPKVGNEGTNITSASSIAPSTNSSPSSSMIQPIGNKPINKDGITPSNEVKTNFGIVQASGVETNLNSTISDSEQTHQALNDSSQGKFESTVVPDNLNQSSTNAVPAQATAQLIQTPQGPRIILQGIQAANIPKEQLQSIQQQVKNQLLKAQAEAKKDHKVPPTKIAIQLPPSMQTKLPSETSLTNKTEVNDESKTLSMSMSSNPTTLQGQSGISNAHVQQSNVAAAIDAGGDTKQGSAPQPIMLQPHPAPTGVPGQKVIVMNQQKVGYATPIASLTSPIKPQPNTSLLLSSLQHTKSNSPVTSNSAVIAQTSQNNQIVRVIKSSNALSSSKLNDALTQDNIVKKPDINNAIKTENQMSTEVTSPKETNHILEIESSSKTGQPITMDGKGDKFELTPGYIQKTISNALKSDNLSPEIEQKLLALQDHNTDKTQNKSVTRKDRKNAIDPETGEPMDDEWDPHGTKSRYIRKKMEKDKAHTDLETEQTNVSRSNFICINESPASNTLNSDSFDTNVPNSDVIQEGITPLRSPSMSESFTSPQTNITENDKTSITISNAPETESLCKVQNSWNDESSQNSPKKQNADSKLFSMLDHQKELLKKDIAKKRALQENESRVDIQRQIESAKNSSSTNLTMTSKFPSKTEYCDEMVGQDKLSSTLESTVVPEHTTDTTQEKSIDLQESIHQKSIGGIQSSVSDEEEIKKRKRSKSDDFENFEEQSEIPARKKRKTIANNLPSKKDKLYCICKKKYDATKFYVGCDVCNEWVSNCSN